MSGTPVGEFRLPAIVDLNALDGMRDGLLDAIEQGPVVIAGAEVERISTNALVMLLSAQESARRNGTALTLQGASPAMLSAIDRLGLKPHFSDLMEV